MLKRLIVFVVVFGCASDDDDTLIACDCGAIWQPVCAEGITYDNECLARCDGENNITDGACDD